MLWSGMVVVVVEGRVGGDDGEDDHHGMTLHISAGRLGSPLVSLSYLASPRQKRRNAVCLQVRHLT